MRQTRRSFLKVGALTAIALAAGGGIYRLVKGPTPASAFVLNGEAKAVIDAIVPAMLDGAMPSEAGARTAAIAATTAGVHKAISGLPLSAQQEVQDLFGLLALGPARRFLAGVPEEWSKASTAQVQEFLQGWRMHRIGALQPAYHAMHDLVIGAWYAQPANWAAIGYPGPIKELS